MDLHAEGANPAFTREAIDVIFRHTQGNPRLINRVCAAALGLARSRQDGAIGRAVAVEATGEFSEEPGRQRRGRFLFRTAAAGLVGGLVLVAGVYFARRNEAPVPPAAGEPVVLSLPATPEPASAPAPPAEPVPELPAPPARSGATGCGRAGIPAPCARACAHDPFRAGGCLPAA